MKINMKPVLEITEQQNLIMLKHIEDEYPLEACGLLAGISQRVEKVLPIRNIFKSPSRYQMDPREQLRAFNEFEAEGLDLLAIYHSHPDGPAYPSGTDIDQAFYPDAFSLIWSQLSGNWICRAFWIRDGQIEKINLQFYSNR
jgi:proteasome lid subunit RPN8/RPN11